MMANCIAYKAGYEYQLKHEYCIDIEVRPEQLIDIPYLTLTPEGKLTVKVGYAWDGPSGPTIDTLNFMRGSLVHDALYQLMRERQLDHEKYRELADRLLQKMCREDGMSAIRAWIVYHGVRLGGGPSADPANDRPIVYAPRQCV